MRPCFISTVQLIGMISGYKEFSSPMTQSNIIATLLKWMYSVKFFLKTCMVLFPIKVRIKVLVSYIKMLQERVFQSCWWRSQTTLSSDNMVRHKITSTIFKQTAFTSKTRPYYIVWLSFTLSAIRVTWLSFLCFFPFLIFIIIFFYCKG